MSFNSVCLAFAGILFLGSCTTSAPPGGQDTSSISLAVKAARCSVFEVLSAKASIGTGFFYLLDNRLYALTPTHVLLSTRKEDLAIRPACGTESYAVSSTQRMPGLDVSILGVSTARLTPGILGRASTIQFGEAAIALGFPGLSVIEPRYFGKVVPSSGTFIEHAGVDALFTLPIVLRGSSGSPVLDSDGRLLAILTNRVLIDGQYTGTAYGISDEALRKALRSLK